MGVVQVWLLVGVPALVAALLLFYGRSRWRSALGYVVLLAGFLGVATVDRASAALFGTLIALVYAAGRGGAVEAGDAPEGQDYVPEVTQRVHRERHA